MGCTYASETTAATTAAPEATEGPGADWPGCKWHMDVSVGSYKGCTNSDNFPDAWEGDSNQMFDSAAECCGKWYGGNCNTIKDEGCSYGEETEETGTTITEAPASPDCMWHQSTTLAGMVCTNDQVYPSAWLDNKDYWFYSTSKEW